MADRKEAILIGDVYTNIINTVSGKSENFKIVTNYYDGTPMSNAKVDGYLYKRKGSTYLRRVIDKDGELFLEKDNMAQMRALSSAEILLIKAGVYRGVKLNGYYTKGDTPAPVEYYSVVNSNPDDGGSTLVVSDIKLEHSFIGEVNAKYYGIFGSSNDNTQTQALVSYVNRSSVPKITVDTDLHISSRMVFTRGVEVDFRGNNVFNSLDGNKYESCIEFRGSITFSTAQDVTADIAPNSNLIQVASPLSFQAGDYIVGFYNRTALEAVQVSGSYTESAVFLTRVVSSSLAGVKIEHNHQFGYVQSDFRFTEPLAIAKCEPIIKPALKNANIYMESTTAGKRLGGCTLWLCYEPKVNVLYTYKSKSQAIYIITSSKGVYDTISNVSPEDVTAGRGYTMQEIAGVSNRISNLKGINDRHTYDSTLFTTDAEVKDSIGIDSDNYSFGCHPFTIGRTRFINCTSIRNDTENKGGFNMGNGSTFPEGTDGGAFGDEVGDVEFINCQSIGGGAKFYASNRVKTGVKRLINCKIDATSDVYALRLTSGSVIEGCDFGSTARIRYYPDYTGGNTTSIIKTSRVFGITAETVAQNLNVSIYDSNINLVQTLNNLLLDRCTMTATGTASFPAISNVVLNNSIISAGVNITFQSTVQSVNLYNTSLNVTGAVQVLGTTFKAVLLKHPAGNIEFGATLKDAVFVESDVNNVIMTGLGATSNLSIINSKLNYIINNNAVGSAKFIGNIAATGSIGSGANFTVLGNTGINATWNDKYTPATPTARGAVNQGVAVANGSTVDQLLASLRAAGIIAT